MPDAPPEPVVQQLIRRYPKVPRDVILDELAKVGNHFGLAVSGLRSVAKQYDHLSAAVVKPDEVEHETDEVDDPLLIRAAQAKQQNDNSKGATMSQQKSSHNIPKTTSSDVAKERTDESEPIHVVADIMVAMAKTEEGKLQKANALVQEQLQKRKRERDYSTEVLQMELEEQISRAISCGVSKDSTTMVEAKQTLAQLLDLQSVGDDDDDPSGQAAWDAVPDEAKPGSRLAQLQEQWAEQEVASLAKKKNEWKGLATVSLARKGHKSLKGLISKNHEVVNRTKNWRGKQAAALNASANEEEYHLSSTAALTSMVVRAKRRFNRAGKSETAQELASDIDTTGLSKGRLGLFESRKARFKWALEDENARWDRIVERFETVIDRKHEEAKLRRYQKVVDEEEGTLERAFKMRQHSRNRRIDNLMIRLSLLTRKVSALLDWVSL